MEAAHKFYDDNKAVLIEFSSDHRSRGLHEQGQAGQRRRDHGREPGRVSNERSRRSTGPSVEGHQCRRGRRLWQERGRHVRKRVVAKAKSYKVELPKLDDEMYMLCARMHNGGLSKERSRTLRC